MKRFSAVIAAFLLTVFCLSAEQRTFANPGKMPPIKEKGRPSVALVLSGGGINGAAEIPVLEKIEELGIPVDMIIGTSIGAIVGGLYSSGYTIDQIYKLFFEQNWPEIFADFSPSVYEKLYESHGTKENLLPLRAGFDARLQIGKGLTNGQKAYQMLKELTLKIPSDINFDDLPIPFRCVATDMITGEPYLFSSGDISEAIRASMNVGGLFEPLYIDGHYLLDGGLTYNMPVSIAKKMGYDIVIAVEIGPSSNKSVRTYDSIPLYTLQDSIYIPMKTVDKIEAQLADLTLYPDMSKFEITDFDRAAEIYEEGLKAVQAAAGEFEKIRNRIYPKGNSISAKEDLYSSRKNITPSKLVINDAFNEDKKYIYKLFQDFTKNNCTHQAYRTFISGIYKTGHYKIIRTRMLTADNEEIMELNLTPKPKPSIMFLASNDLQQSASPKNLSSYINANLAIQFRGITNADSLLSLRATVFNDWIADLMFFQPLTKNCYLRLQSKYAHDIYGTYEHYISWNNTLSFGLNYLNHAYTDQGIFCNLSRVPVDFTTKDRTNSLDTGLFIKYYFSILDQPCFSRKGISVDAMGKYIVPIQQQLCFKQASITGDINLKAAVPVGKKFSIGMNTFAGFDFSGNLNKNRELMILEGYSNYNRIYFPQNGKKNVFSSQMLASSITLQFTPVENLTIAGGQIYILANGTWGTLGKMSEGLWSASAGFGLKIWDSCNLLVKFGAGSNYETSCIPFLSLDFGAIKF